MALARNTSSAGENKLLLTIEAQGEYFSHKEYGHKAPVFCFPSAHLILPFPTSFAPPSPPHHFLSPATNKTYCVQGFYGQFLLSE